MGRPAVRCRSESGEKQRTYCNTYVYRSILIFRMGEKLIEIDVVIPVYKPDHRFLLLIDKLERQTVPIRKLIIMNTEQKYFDRLIYGSSFMEKYKNIEVKHLSKREFDHGRTRNNGIARTESEFFVLLTQDAMPVNEHLLEELLKPMANPQVAVSYARQIPNSTCNIVEQIARSFNYPEQSAVKSQKDLTELGIKTYFCSNVCAAYRRQAFQEVGGFERHAIFNEDMIFAARAVKAGWSIAYAAEAQVIHSHNYNAKVYFHRYFDMGVSQANHPEIFQEVPPEKEGASLFKNTLKYLWNNKNKGKILGLFTSAFCKYSGYWLGKHYRLLPRWLIIKATMNRTYWEKI